MNQQSTSEELKFLDEYPDLKVHVEKFIDNSFSASVSIDDHPVFGYNTIIISTTEDEDDFKSLLEYLGTTELKYVHFTAVGLTQNMDIPDNAVAIYVPLNNEDPEELQEAKDEIKKVVDHYHMGFEALKGVYPPIEDDDVCPIVVDILYGFFEGFHKYV